MPSQRVFSNPTSFGNASSLYSSSGTSGKDSLYNITVPSKDDNQPQRSGIKIMLGKIDNGAKSLASKAPQKIRIFQMSLVDVGRLVFHNALNPLTIAFIFLSVCASLYSSIGQCFLQANSEVSDARAYAIPYVAAAVQEHSISGLNATAYNMLNAATMHLSSLSNSYVNAQIEVCQTMNETAPSTNNGKLISLLSKRGVNDQSKITDPYHWASLHCGNNGIQKVNVTEAGLSTIAALGHTVVSEISDMSDIRVPALNITSFSNTDYVKLNGKVRDVGIAWVVVFACFSVLSIGMYWLYDHAISEYGTEEKVAMKMLEHDQDKKNGVEHSGFYRVMEACAYYCGSAYRWMENNFISGSINRLLYIALILGLFGISNSTILGSIHLEKLQVQSALDQSWFNSVQSAYSQYESNFNENAVKYISAFIKGLNDNHQVIARELSEMYEFTVTSSLPFPNGVALNVINLPLVGTRTLPDRVLTPGGSIHTFSTILQIVKNLATGCWVSFIVLCAIWIICTLCYYFFAI